MTKIKIVTDSSANLTDEEVQKYDITVIPLTVMIDGTIYVEDETITREEFISKMATAKSLPKTSQPALGTFIETFDKLGADGSSVVCINMLEAISGTVHTAEQAASISKTDVTVIDAKTTDRAMSFQVVTAAKLAQAGADKQAVIDAVHTTQEHTKLFMGVMTLNNLVAGGRISRLTGAISTLLNVKIALEVDNGDLDVKMKGRGVKAINKFFDKVLDDIIATPNVVEVAISHVGATERVEEYKARLQAALPSLKVSVQPTVPIIATHGGPGAFAVEYHTQTPA
ncbi:DegV family protein [Lactiplantibacillus paraxiangfangensis]|uniref:DegV family protein n=1 Tax=Lactiplantibacillus paraxiangfangensis TaxID=3076224 RepID=UPI0030C6F5D8